MKKYLYSLLCLSLSNISFAGSTFVSDSPTIEIDDQMGNSLAFFEFDAGPTQGMVIGVKGEDDGQGGIMYYANDDADPVFVKYSGNPGDGFGYSVGTGFLNKDVYMDIVVGVPWADYGGYTNAGEVHIFYGSPDGYNWSNPEVIRDTATPQSGARFGFSIAVADMKDMFYGVDELIVGIPYLNHSDDVNAGAIRIYHRTLPFLKWGSQLIHQATSGVAGTPEDNDRFGWAVDADDSTGIIAVGVPYESVGDKHNAGMVQLFRLNKSLGLSGNTYFHQGSANVGGEPEDGDRFGFDVAIDRYGILIGIPGEDITFSGSEKTDAGAVQLIGIDPITLAGTHYETHYQSTAAFNGTPEDGDDFGIAVDLRWDDTCGYYNTCSKVLEMLVGAPGEDSDKGYVHYYADGDKVNIHQNVLIGNSREAGDRFGRAIALSRGAILVGALKEHLNQKSNTGAAHRVDLDYWGNFTNERFLSKD